MCTGSIAHRCRGVRRRRRGGGRQIDDIVLGREERLKGIQTDIVEIDQVDRLDQIGVVLYERVGIVLYEGLSGTLNHCVEIRGDIRLIAVNRLSAVVLLVGRTMIIYMLMVNLIGCVD